MLRAVVMVASGMNCWKSRPTASRRWDGISVLWGRVSEPVNVGARERGREGGREGGREKGSDELLWVEGWRTLSYTLAKITHARTHTQTHVKRRSKGRAGIGSDSTLSPPPKKTKKTIKQTHKNNSNK